MVMKTGWWGGGVGVVCGLDIWKVKGKRSLLSTVFNTLVLVTRLLLAISKKLQTLLFYTKNKGSFVA